MNGIDFGYPWLLSYGHLCLAALLGVVLYLVRKRGWARLLVGSLLLWSLAGAAVMKLVLRVDGRGELPAADYLSSGPASVVDLGAGTGRSALMVLEGRPATTVTAVDLFGQSYVQHFGAEGNAAAVESAGHAKLRRNLELAGVASRARIVTANVLKLPFPDATFDGAISCYVIDHLPSADIAVALSEAHRVLKPGAQFLLMVIQKDAWMRIAFGPFTLHSRFRGPERWTELLRGAGFEVPEQGARPMTLYFVARRPA